MRAQRGSEATRQRQLALEKRLQTGAALVFAVIALVVIVLRAGAHTVFTPGWWRH